MFKRLKTLLLPVAIFAAVFGGVSANAMTLPDLSAGCLAETRVGGYQVFDAVSYQAETTQPAESQQATAFSWYDTASECSVAAKSLPEAERLVIGRGADLAKPGALGPGEFKLSWPPTATVKSEWKVNSGLLRQEMGNLRPIRDASIDDVGGMYLNAERYLLKDRGWTLDAGTSLWMPPTP